MLGLGLLSVFLVVWLAHRMDVVDHESHPIHLAPDGLLFIPWLMLEIFKANIDVALAIIKSKKENVSESYDLWTEDGTFGYTMDGILEAEYKGNTNLSLPKSVWWWD